MKPCLGVEEVREVYKDHIKWCILLSVYLSKTTEAMICM